MHTKIPRIFRLFLQGETSGITKSINVKDGEMGNKTENQIGAGKCRDHIGYLCHIEIFRYQTLLLW